MSDDPRYCPSCKADLQGAPIPQDSIDKGYYAPGSTHFGRTIGVEISDIYDGVCFWECPDCGHQWERKGMEWAFEEYRRRENGQIES